MFRTSAGRLIGAAVVSVALFAFAGTSAMASGSPTPNASAHHRIQRFGNVFGTLASRHSVPTTRSCRKHFGISCYAPFQFQRAYDLKPLYKHGLDGTGETIAIIDSFGSPTAQADLNRFDQDFGLPAPPSFNVIQPAGQVPPYDPNNDDMVGWAVETSLDVQYAHAMAPGASILLVETPTSETEGVTGFPEIVQAENYVIDHGLAQVISQSFAATEATFPDHQAILDLRSAFVNAAANDVTVLGASGDSGATDYKLDLEHLYAHRVNSWPSSDPLVTSVGGTQLHLNRSGRRIAPDNVWNDQAVCGGPCASGGGVSAVFSRPSFQSGVRSEVGRKRGTPDISLSAAVDGGALVYLGMGGLPSGYYIVGGTSEATPQFAGVVAIADQAAGHALGDINPALYQLAAQGAPGIVDVTSGDNTVSFVQGSPPKVITVKGYSAGPGYDLASGLGTIDGAKLVHELASI